MKFITRPGQKNGWRDPAQRRAPLWKLADLAAEIGVEHHRLAKIVGAAALSGNGPPAEVGWKDSIQRGSGRKSWYRKPEFLAWWAEWIKTHPVDAP